MVMARSGLQRLRGFFRDWGAMAAAGQRIGVLMCLSADELRRAGYQRETLVLQVYREHGIGGSPTEPLTKTVSGGSARGDDVGEQGKLRAGEPT